MRDAAPFMGQLAREGPCPIYRHYHSLPFESTDITSRIEIRNQFSHGRSAGTTIWTVEEDVSASTPGITGMFLAGTTHCLVQSERPFL